MLLMKVKSQRPTAPHLQVYKLPLTGLLSITHRITGIALSAGLVLIVYFLYALAQGEPDYLAVQHWANFWLGKAVYWSLIFALFLHFCHGIRHLLWDIGEGFAADLLFKYAVLEVVAALSLTFTVWLVT